MNSPAALQSAVFFARDDTPGLDYTVIVSSQGTLNKMAWEIRNYIAAQKKAAQSSSG